MRSVEGDVVPCAAATTISCAFLMFSSDRYEP